MVLVVAAVVVVVDMGVDVVVTGIVVAVVVWLGWDVITADVEVVGVVLLQPARLPASIAAAISTDKYFSSVFFI
jgi:vacuolar-type H+-ATPase subunit I/STV1